MTRSRTSSNPLPSTVKEPTRESTAGSAFVRTLPGILGAVLLAGGVAVIYWPAGIIAAGLLLLALDRRI